MGKRYMVRWFNNRPEIRMEPDGVMTFLEAKEQVVGWYVTQAEWWMALREEDWNATPF